MATAEFIGLLQQVKRSSDGWMARCPAHDDHTPSLSIWDGPDGEPRVNCFAGCDFRAVFSAVEYQRTTSIRRGIDDAVKKAMAVFPYHDESGIELYEIVRTAPKQFSARRRLTDGTIVKSIKGVRRVPFRLPQVIAQARSGERIFVVEGEKDVLTLEGLGYVATTCALGGNSWESEWAPYFAGADVVVLPDNDAVGESYATEVAHSLQRTANSVRVVRLPDLQPGGDVTDWLADGGDAKQLERLIDSTEDARLTAAATSSSVASERGIPSSVRVITLSSVQPKAVEWLWPGYLPLGKLSILEGDPGLGKSTLSIAIAAAVTRGYGLPGMATTAPADVILITYEDDLADTIRPRLDAAGADLDRVHTFYLKETSSSTERYLSLPRDIPELRSVVEEKQARYVIVDPLVAALSAETDSYKDADIRRVLAPLAQLAEDTRAALMGVRHLNKARGGRAIASGGGSIGIAAAARIVLALHPDPDSPEHGRVLAIVKSNLAKMAPSVAFALATQENGCARVAWAGTSNHSAETLTALRSDENGETTGALREAEEWLAAQLEEGPMTRRDLQKAAQDAGHGWRTVERASERLKTSKQSKGFGRSKASVWSLPSFPPIRDSAPHTGAHGGNGDVVAGMEDLLGSVEDAA
jgi:putative DNA primase/helicase